MDLSILQRASAVALALVLASCAATAESPGPSIAQTGEPTQTQTPTAVPEPPETSTPEPTRSASPSPTPESGFEDPSTCTNDTIGYTVRYPGDWWANEPVSADEPVADVAGCLYFAPDPVTIEPGTDDFTGIAIRASLTADAATHGDVLSSEEVTVAGREATVREVQLAPQQGFIPEGALVYEYVIPHGDEWLVFAANNFHVEEGTYGEAKEVVDSMMDAIEIDD